MNSFLLGIICLIYAIVTVRTLFQKDYFMALVYFSYALSIVGFILHEYYKDK